MEKDVSKGEAPATTFFTIDEEQGNVNACYIEVPSQKQVLQHPSSAKGHLSHETGNIIFIGVTWDVYAAFSAICAWTGPQP
jgi:hypothetical protein